MIQDLIIIIEFCCFKNLERRFSQISGEIYIYIIYF